MQTFDNFFICPENKIAATLASEVSLPCGGICPPLFIFGNTGIGKTHLLNAVKHKNEERNPGSKIVYFTVEDFAGELISSIRNDTQNEFKDKFIQSDILLIDELDEIEGKHETQQVLLSFINKHLLNGRQIVISSCRSPFRILISGRTIIRRMNSVIVRIDKPGYKSRLAYLHHFVKENNITCSDNVLELIAQKFKTDFSVLGSMLSTMDRVREFSGEEITVETVKFFLKDKYKDHK